MIESFAQRVILLWGWRRGLASVAAGAIGALSLAPLNLWPMMVPAMVLSVWLLDGAATASASRWSMRAVRAAFVVGWCFGFGYLVAGLWWLGAAFLVEDDQFAWALPLGVLGLPAALAIIYGIGFAIARIFWTQDARRICALAGALGLVEWLRGWIFTGFPWNTLGQSLAASDPLMQIASVVGSDGMTPLAVLIFASPAVIGTGVSSVGRWLMPFMGALLLGLLAAWGAHRLERTPVTFVPDVRIRIMQPNLSQREKHRLSGQEVLTRYLSLSDRARAPGASGMADVTHLVWPESPFPFLLAREPEALSQIARMLQPKAILITGAARAEESAGPPRYFNSIHVVAPDGSVVDSYDKVHLVPFGEYLPFRQWFEWLGLRQFVEVPGGFQPGLRRRALVVSGMPAVWPLICYEAIFPSQAMTQGQAPGLLLNVTNDAWFGLTPGPHQHLLQARLRSVEQGLPMIRAGNTGISAVLDPLGRVVNSLPLGVEGVVDSGLPRAIPTTMFAKLQNFALLAGILLLFMIPTVRKRR